MSLTVSRPTALRKVGRWPASGTVRILAVAYRVELLVQGLADPWAKELRTTRIRGKTRSAGLNEVAHS